jgi:SRSO17 transposase
LRAQERGADGGGPGRVTPPEAPARTAAQHQSLLHFVGQASWSDEKVLAKMCEMVLPAMERDGPIEAWIIDDTGFPKKSKHSVGVARQYCGQLGNCQAAVSLSIANRQASLPVRYRLYLPQEWASDAARRRKAHVPEEIVFETKSEIAVGQLRWTYAAGLPRGVVLLDAGYGNHMNLRTQINALGLSYAAGILSTTSVWAPAPSHCRPSDGPVMDGRRHGRGAAPSTSRSRSSSWRSDCPGGPGVRSAGARGPASN